MKPVSAVLRAIVDFAIPPRCLACGESVEAQGTFCAGCWASLRFITDPCCRQCGSPLPHAPTGEADGLLCAACLARPPAWSHARALWHYDGAAMAPILRFKHGDRAELATALATLLARAGGSLLAGPDVVLVPVPLHRWRFVRRMYNQSALLARALGRRCAVPVLVDALVRRRATRSQQGLSAAERQTNVRGAFAVRPAAAGRLAGRCAVLVDDVVTTGATAEACARALLAAGAREVRLLSLAKVVRPSQIL